MRRANKDQLARHQLSSPSSKGKQKFLFIFSYKIIITADCLLTTIGDLKNLVPNKDDPSCKGKIQRFLANFLVMVCVATPVVTICYFAFKP